jgi:hypothetical protein
MYAGGRGAVSKEQRKKNSEQREDGREQSAECEQQLCSLFTVHCSLI